MGRPHIVWLCALSVASTALLGAEAAAQSLDWSEGRTTQGCLFRAPWSGWLRGEHRLDARWSGSCVPGRYIDGEGTLSGARPVDMEFTGRMIDGYFHGEVRRHWPDSGSRDTVRMDMGCYTYIRNVTPNANCRPGVAASASRTPTPPSVSGEAISEEVRALLARAEAGDATAQARLGYRYATGDGAPQNDAEAIRWYRRAAEQGQRTAQFNLGVRYDSGRGIPRDYAEAMRWYRRAAEQGHANARNSIGAMYHDGKGVPRDYAEAMRWYEQALLVEPENENAINNLRRAEASRQPQLRSEQEVGTPPGQDREQTYVDPNTGAPCVGLKAQDHDDGRFWRDYRLVLTNTCPNAFYIRAGVIRWDDNPLFQEQRRMIHRRQPGAAPTEIVLTCSEARRPITRGTYRIGCGGFSGWAVTGFAEAW